MNLDNDRHDPAPPEREISLDTGAILGIFLALALICAVFFGFGYTLGRRSTQITAANPTVNKSDATFSNFKSNAVDPGASSGDDASSVGTSQAEPDSPSESQPAVPAVKRLTNRVDASQAPGTPSAQSIRNVAFSAPLQRASAAQAESSSSPASAGQVIVQVSATSREGDAQSLLAALRRKGYNATIRQEPQDKLYHVQLGSFASKKDADIMRVRLDGDGYKAIVK